MTTTAKRHRQREGRVARMEAERRAAIKAARRRRLLTAVVVAALVVGVMALIAVLGGRDESGDDQAAESTTTTEGSPSTTAPPKPDVTVPDTPPPTTLQSTDITVGTGPEAKVGDTVQVHYVGKAYSTKEEFDSSYERGDSFPFVIGEGNVIPGWDQGVAGMKVGGRRQLVIPPDLGYGAEGQGDKIGPNETLVFVVDLLSVDETPPTAPGGG